MVEKALALLLGSVYTPAIWLLVGLHAALGLLGLVIPGALRKVVGLFRTKTPVRLLGLVLVALGALLFLGAEQTARVVLVKTLGVLCFVKGGVALLIPMALAIPAERWAECKGLGLRFLGLAYCGIAFLFYLATKAAPVVEEILENGVDEAL